MKSRIRMNKTPNDLARAIDCIAGGLMREPAGDSPSGGDACFRRTAMDFRHVLPEPEAVLRNAWGAARHGRTTESA
jgi:hypothetical protein